ncbi:cupin domain-containing protein [Egibacter rhizosphaerae]|uniref:Cupin domain-containing protein n=1 Tax=Egibacter rhizosphaerae TaxID=1670831 RepID=A0A411YI81_9ACTN|nr:cupin domain-containing protein [Egibacter rhizosphaerae]QBI20897.1 cupin domain-containing protein [Egibacter rhizosphaerae]
MAPLHVVQRADEAVYETPEEFAGRSSGFRRWQPVDEAGPSVHMGFGVCELDPGGYVPWHVHAYEESFYVLEGEVVCETSAGAVLLTPGDYGLIPFGGSHRWHNPGDARVRWAEMLAPQPRAELDDLFLVDPPLRDPGEPIRLDVRDPRTRSFGHIEPSNMEVDKQSQDQLAVSASMRTALLVYSGITVKMMVDSDLGADLSTMFMVQYVPHGVAGAHDHPFEEAYLILEGEVEATLDGRTHRLGPGDIAFAGVGSRHAFKNLGDGPVRWLETQAPQPPGRDSYRFARDWQYLRDLG